MARVKMVTRTVEVTSATFMTLNVETAEVQNLTHSIPGNHDAKSALMYAISNLQTETVRYATCTAVTVNEILYGMPEAKFMELATILPPRTKQNSDAE